ncbi:MAG TPA: hypothetical protein PKN75_10885 [Bacteroidia bacterium]|nr:hypothetical protein [Bacteroidia bacterium]HNU34084.1 hypothetical protein [Bacteroidia bacterium]
MKIKDDAITVQHQEMISRDEEMAVTPKALIIRHKTSRINPLEIQVSFSEIQRKTKMRDLLFF